jgi:hypothetical protein
MMLSAVRCDGRHTPHAGHDKEYRPVALLKAAGRYFLESFYLCGTARAVLLLLQTKNPGMPAMLAYRGSIRGR